MNAIDLPQSTGYFSGNLPSRNRAGGIWRGVFLVSTLIGIVFLAIMLFTILNDSFGYIVVEYGVNPDALAVNGIPIWELPKQDLILILQEHVTPGRFRTLEKEKAMDQRSRENIHGVIVKEIVKPDVAQTWTLTESILNKKEIEVYSKEKYPDGELYFKAWLNWDFITSPQSSDPLYAGIRTAILGSLWLMGVAILFALPIGTGAAIYLEEFAGKSWLNNLIRTNINNLAGVPSIIYGILGLAVFVRVLEPITSGAVFGYGDPSATLNGRTILSGGLTLGLLILPIIIINAQEALKAVPNSLREASYGVGATKWQTVWSHVLPYAIPGIMTGSILAFSRAFGETAPLVVIGASTYIVYDPTSVFSKFTALPIQIYQWTSRPQDEFRNLAAAAIIVLLALLLTLNAVAIFIRNRYSRRY
jgi:phosphate transport system permease protein